MFRNYESSSISIIGGKVMNQLEFQRKVIREEYANLTVSERRLQFPKRPKTKKQGIIKEFHTKSILSER
jgi:hypothetical protein